MKTQSSSGEGLPGPHVVSDLMVDTDLGVQMLRQQDDSPLEELMRG